MKPKGRYAPDVEPSRLGPKSKHRKPEPRYRVEIYLTWSRHGEWFCAAKCRTLAEAEWALDKERRSWSPSDKNHRDDFRIVDTQQP